MMKPTEDRKHEPIDSGEEAAKANVLLGRQLKGGKCDDAAEAVDIPEFFRSES